MRWEDERYVRVYTRDTIDWQFLSFEAQALMVLLLRKVDRAGVLEFGRRGVAGVAAAIGHPGRWESIEPALKELIADRCVDVTDTRLVVPNFIEAQEAKTSDKERQRKSRELARVSHTLSHAVTDGHTVSQPVTLSLAVPSRAEPLKLAGEKPPAAPKQKRAPKEKKPPDPRHAPMVDALVAAAPGYAFDGGRDARAVTELLGKGADEEILKRWVRARGRTGFPLVRSLPELATHWNHFATDTPAKAVDYAKGMVRAQDVDRKAFEKTGVIDGF